MSAYDTDYAAMGLPNQGPCWGWRAQPAVPDPEPLTRAEKNRIQSCKNMQAKRAAAASAKMTEPVPSKWNKAELVPAKLGKSSFSVHIASPDESRRSNSIGSRK